MLITDGTIPYFHVSAPNCSDWKCQQTKTLNRYINILLITERFNKYILSRREKTMTKKEIREHIISIIKSVIERQESNLSITNDQINDNTNLSIDLGMDSIEIITVIVGIENDFDIEFDYSDMEIEKITILANIVNSLEQILSKKQ